MIAVPEDEKDLLEELRQENPDALLADGFEEALIGITANYHQPVVAIYDLDLCAEVLIKGGMTADEALEHISYNVLGAYVGDNGPIFMRVN